MRRSLLCGTVAITLVATLGLAVPSGAATPRAPLWEQLVSPSNGAAGTSVVAGPAGATVYVGGQTVSAPNRFLVAAYATGTGEPRWRARLACSTAAVDLCWLDSLAVSPDGATVYLTGRDETATDAFTWVTMALDARTGARRWTARVPNAIGCCDTVVVSPDADRIFVAGWTSTMDARSATTVAYDAATGAKLWRTGRAGWGYADAFLVMNPDGSLLYRTTLRYPTWDMETFALDPATGDVVWSHRFGGKGLDDLPGGIAVAPSGTRLYVTDFRVAVSEPIYRPPITLAYDAMTGKPLWKVIERGLAPAAQIVGVGTAGGRAFVTDGKTMVGRAASTGRELWRTKMPAPDGAWVFRWDLTVSPGGGRVFVALSILDEATLKQPRVHTVAMNTDTGKVRWTALRYRAGESGIVAGPSGAKVFVAGSFTQRRDIFDGMLTLAYAA